MCRNQNLRELNVNVISCFTICMEREIREWQFSLFFVILNGKITNFNMLSREIADIA